MQIDNDSIVIDRLGGTVAVAALCQTSPSAVSQWRTSGIPKARLMFLRLARPEVFEAAERPDAPGIPEASAA